MRGSAPGPRRRVARLMAETKIRKGRARVAGASSRMTATVVLAAFRFALVVFVAGCASIGPTSVPRDRVDYITAVAESWKEQTFRNVVRMRYRGRSPSFLDVLSVISAYAFQGQLSAGAAISSNLTNTIPSNLVTLGGNASYLDRPTITYTPLAGDKFAKSLLRPIPPSAIFELFQAGYPADVVLQITMRAINGVITVQASAGVRARRILSYSLLDALRRLQLSGAVSLRLEKHGADESGGPDILGQTDRGVDKDLLYVKTTLGVGSGKNSELTLTFGALPFFGNSSARRLPAVTDPPAPVWGCSRSQDRRRGAVAG